MNQNTNIIQGVEAHKSGGNINLDTQIRCLTLNFFSYKMILPNAVVAEVTEMGKIEPRLGAPDWFAGTMLWREQETPVLVFEKIMNPDASKPQNYRRVIILNAPENKGCAPFIALGCQSIPSLSMVDESRVSPSELKDEQVVHIKLDGEQYIIPRIDYLEQQVSIVMDPDNS